MTRNRWIPAAAWAAVVLVAGTARGQVGGNLGYSQGGAKARAEQEDQARRRLAESDRPPSGTTSFVEADVLMNVRADEFVAVFGLAQEGETVADCSRKMDAVSDQLIRGLKEIGLRDEDLFLDFITQTRVYGYEVAGAIAREKLVGFELKKNLSIHYKDHALIDRIAVVAARSEVFDLIKVDYVVRDLEPIQDRLADEAARVVKRKVARHERLLGIKLQPPAQVYAEKFGANFPAGQYDQYAAAEAEEITGLPARERYTIQNARKGRTFVFNGLDADGFDVVINPVVTEPVVQFTLHLKLKYEVEQPRPR